jgi:hypothetical protein
LHTVKIKRLPPDWRIERPLRSFLRAAVIISLLFCLATAFADVPNHWVFLVAGLGYSLFLAFVSIGICILPHRTRARVFALMFGVQTCCLLVGAAIFAVAYYAHRLPSLPTSSVVFPLVLVLAVLVVFASRGWYLHITRAVDRNA